MYRVRNQPKWTSVYILYIWAMPAAFATSFMLLYILRNHMTRYRDIKCFTLWGGLKWQKSHHYLVHFLKQHFWARASLGQYYHCTISEDIFLAQCQTDYRLLKIVKRVPHKSIEYCAFIRIKIFWFWLFSIAHVPTMKYRCYSLDIVRIKYKTHVFVGIQCLEQLVVLHNQYVFKYAHMSWNNMWENKMFAICSN